MIKPASYWALHKTADAETLGRVALALAGREGELSPPLAYAEKLIVGMIRQDSEWMDENIAEKKRRVSEAVKRHRERKKSESENVNGEIITPITPPSNVAPECNTPPTSIPPTSSVLPSSEDCLYIQHAPHEQLQTGDIELKEVVNVAVHTMGVPEAYARWWFKQMQDSDWKTTKGLAVNRRNWRAQLKAWYNRATPDEIDKINREMAKSKKAVVRVSVKDWELCKERCANCANGISCVKGVKIPPTKDTPPKPPEECPHYYALNTAKNGAVGA